MKKQWDIFIVGTVNQQLKIGKSDCVRIFYAKELILAIPEGHKKNFQTLSEAFAAGNVALMECQLAATGEEVEVLCAANGMADGSVGFVPFAIMFNDNPYEILNPPNPNGGFHS